MNNQSKGSGKRQRQRTRSEIIADIKSAISDTGNRSFQVRLSTQEESAKAIVITEIAKRAKISEKTVRDIVYFDPIPDEIGEVWYTKCSI